MERIRSHKDLKVYRMSYRAGMMMVLLFSMVACQTKENTLLTEDTPASVNISEERLSRIDNMIMQYIDSGWIAGAAGLIVRDGRIVYNKAFGISDAETKKELATDSVMN